MAKATAVREAPRKSPFGSPSDDETFEIMIPEGAESGKIPAGDQYIGKLLGAVVGKSKADNPMVTWTFTVNEGDFEGMDFRLWTPLTDNSMWKVSDVLAALGVPAKPGVKMTIKPKELVGTLVRMVIKDDSGEYQNKSKLDRILPHPDGAGTKATKGKGFTVPSKAEEDDEEEEAPRRKRPRDEDDEPEEYEEKVAKRGRKPVDDEDEDEEEDERPVKRGRKAAVDEDMDEVWNKKSSKRRVVEDEDEEEEEEEPVRRKSTKRSRL